MSLEGLEALQVYSDLWFSIHPEMSPVHGDYQLTWTEEAGVWHNEGTTTGLTPWEAVWDQLERAGLLPDPDGGCGDV